jgi:hypothetical protein
MKKYLSNMEAALFDDQYCDVTGDLLSNCVSKIQHLVFLLLPVLIDRLVE